jgi:hypothetical protein
MDIDEQNRIAKEWVAEVEARLKRDDITEEEKLIRDMIEKARETFKAGDKEEADKLMDQALKALGIPLRSEVKYGMTFVIGETLVRVVDPKNKEMKSSNEKSRSK